MKSRRQIFLRGLRDATPVALGYLAVSFAFGLSAKRLRFSALAASLMSFANLTSAGQFAGAALIAAGTSVAELALTQMVINARYFLMSCALSQKLPQDTPLWQRALMGWGVSDEIFALSAAYPGRLSPHYTYGLMALCLPAWTLGTLLGSLLGAVLPGQVMSALGVALYGMLAAAIVPPSRKDRTLRRVILLAMGCSGLTALLPPLQEIPGGIRIVALTLMITTFFALRYPLREVET
ncbi:MAG: AzlC family ABC transporter permease [Christensenellales bacterium]